MGKAAGFSWMLGIVILFAGADAWLLTRSENLSRVVAHELRSQAGDGVRWEALRASVDGRVALDGVSLAKFPLKAARVDIRLRGLSDATAEEVLIEGARLDLSEKVLEDLRTQEGPKKSIREVFPDPRKMPRILLRGGTLQASFPAILGETAFPVTIYEAALVPISGYRCHISGRFGSELLGTWTVSGEVDLESGVWTLALQCAGFRFTPALRERLAGDARAAMERYRPEGLSDLRLRFGSDEDFAVTVVARDLAFLYRNFPYALTGTKGELEFGPKGFRVKHLEGRHGPAVVRFDGSADGYPAGAAFRFRIEIDDMPLDGDLRAALKPASQKVWDLFKPSGKVRARGRVEHAEGSAPERIPLDLTFSGGTACYANFPYELRNIEGEVHLDGDDVRVKRLVARDGESTLEITGTISEVTTDAAVDLSIEARKLPLDARLKAALAEREREIWDRFLPGGAMDVRWRILKEKGREVVHSGRARALGNTAMYREVPVPVSGIEGEIEIDPGIVRMRHLTGLLPKGARVKLHGTSTDDATTLEELDVVGLDLDDKVKDALPKSVGDFLKQLKLTGQVNFSSTITMKKDGDRLVTLSVALSKGMVDVQPRFEELEGNVWLTGTFGEKAFLMGPLSFSHAKVWGKRLTELTASLTVVDSKVSFTNVKAQAYGGLVAGDFSVDTTSHDFRGGFTIDRLDIAQIARDTQAYAGKALEGKASLEISDLAGRAGDLPSITGKGQLKIRDAQLWDIPLFVSLFQLNPQDLFKAKAAFEAGAIDFDIHKEKFDVKRLAFTSESVSIVGKGRLNFNGEVHFVLKPQSGRLLGIDFFLTNWVGSVLNFLTGGFMGVDVSGTFDEPKTALKAFPGF